MANAIASQFSYIYWIKFQRPWTFNLIFLKSRILELTTVLFSGCDTSKSGRAFDWYMMDNGRNSNLRQIPETEELLFVKKETGALSLKNAINANTLTLNLAWYRWNSLWGLWMLSISQNSFLIFSWIHKVHSYFLKFSPKVTQILLITFSKLFSNYLKKLM